MDFEKMAAQLGGCTLFEGMELRDIVRLLTCFKLKAKKYQKREIIARRGDPTHKFGILLSGEAVISKESGAGENIVLKLLAAGEMFGEMAVFADAPSWPATVTAKELCEVILISKEQLIQRCPDACGFHDTMLLNMLKTVSERARLLNKKVEYLSLKGIRQKLSLFLLDEQRRAGGPLFFVRMNRNEMAEFLNVSRPSMSRELGEMKQQGWIDYSGHSFKILDEHALRGFLQ